MEDFTERNHYEVRGVFLLRPVMFVLVIVIVSLCSTAAGTRATEGEIADALPAGVARGDAGAQPEAPPAAGSGDDGASASASGSQKRTAPSEEFARF